MSCGKMGGRLASFASRAEIDLVKQIIPPTEMWLGKIFQFFLVAKKNQFLLKKGKEGHFLAKLLLFLACHLVATKNEYTTNSFLTSTLSQKI